MQSAWRRMCKRGGGAESGVGGTMEFVFDFIKVDLNNFLNAFVGDAQNLLFSLFASPSRAFYLSFPLSFSLSPFCSSASVYSLNFTVLI